MAALQMIVGWTLSTGVYPLMAFSVAIWDAAFEDAIPDRNRDAPQRWRRKMFDQKR